MFPIPILLNPLQLGVSPHQSTGKVSIRLKYPMFKIYKSETFVIGEIDKLLLNLGILTHLLQKKIKSAKILGYRKSEKHS